MRSRPPGQHQMSAALRTTDQQQGHPNLGFSRKQESGRQTTESILTIEAVLHGAERAEQVPSSHVLPEAPGRELGAVVGLQNRWATAVSITDGHVDRVIDQCGVGGGREGAGHDHAREAVQDRAAVHLAVPRGVFGDVCAPQFVGHRRGEPPTNQVYGGCRHRSGWVFAALGAVVRRVRVRT